MALISSRLRPDEVPDAAREQQDRRCGHRRLLLPAAAVGFSGAQSVAASRRVPLLDRRVSTRVGSAASEAPHLRGGRDDRHHPDDPRRPRFCRRRVHAGGAPDELERVVVRCCLHPDHSPCGTNDPRTMGGAAADPVAMNRHPRPPAIRWRLTRRRPWPPIRPSPSPRPLAGRTRLRRFVKGRLARGQSYRRQVFRARSGALVVTTSWAKFSRAVRSHTSGP